MDVDSKITVSARLLQNLLRRDYMDDPRWVVSEACALAGHPAKIDKPTETKSEWQRGCVCGRNPYA